MVSFSQVQKLSGDLHDVPAEVLVPTIAGRPEAPGELTTVERA